MSTARTRVSEVLAGKYELLRCLGRGGMGEVYEARHLALGRRVAIKLLHDEAARDPALVARFRIEARAAGALSHENIAAVYDAGVHDGADFLVMELLEGQDCASLLSTYRSLPPARAVELALQVCRGLSRAHAGGIVHRDLKPANLFVCARSDGSDLLKILDFGVAKLRAEPARSLALQTGPALGTPHYMSPEQARGDELIDGRTDLYALGVVLYELVSGRRPIEHGTPLQVLHRVLTQTAPPLAQLCPELPPGLSAVVERAMAKRPEDRFASADELANALVALLPARPQPAQSAARSNSSLETAASLRTDVSALSAPHSSDHPSAVAAPSHAGRPADARPWLKKVLAGLATTAALGSLWMYLSQQADPVGRLPAHPLHVRETGPVQTSAHEHVDAAPTFAANAEAVPETPTGSRGLVDASSLPLAEPTASPRNSMTSRSPRAAPLRLPRAALARVRPPAAQASQTVQTQAAPAPGVVDAVAIEAQPVRERADAPSPAMEPTPRQTRRLVIDHESPYQ